MREDDTKARGDIARRLHQSVPLEQSDVSGRLVKLEEVIDRGLKTFIEVGNALREIREGRLYRCEYATFDEYCRRRWGWDRINAHRHIEAATVVDVLSFDNIDGPSNVAQTREIAPLLRKDEREALAVWRELREEYGDRVTAERIRRLVRGRMARLRREDEAREASEEKPTISDTDGAVPNIHCSDFRDLDLEPGSVDLLLTDPPYGSEYLPLWDDLGRFAAQTLKEGGVLAAYSGQTYLPEVMGALGEHLRYWWMIAVVHRHGKPVVWPRRAMNAWKPVLVFTKGKPECGLFRDAMLLGSADGKEGHPWGQPSSEAEELVEAFTEPGDVVLDPFCGSGTVPMAAMALGRRAIACELSPTVHRAAVERILRAGRDLSVDPANGTPSAASSG